MKLSYTSLQCPHSNHDYQKYITVTFQHDDKLLQQAITEGVDLAKKVNPYDPGHAIRSSEQIKRRCICGFLAEITLRMLLKQQISEHNIDAKLLSSHTITEGPKLGSQIDIPIKINNVRKEIEVRSSFPYSSINVVITKLFDIIGWYQSPSKPMEYKKDYYLRVLYNFKEEDAMNHINTEIALHFVGGATRGMLEELGNWNDFDQQGAKYKSIKPICKGLDAIQIMNMIFSRQ